jgi:hypothetical protein
MICFALALARIALYLEILEKSTSVSPGLRRYTRFPYLLSLSRALIWCRAGICKADFEAHTPEIAAACYARQARVKGNQRWAQLVTVDVVRRDTLAAHHVIPSGIARMSPKWRRAS